MTFQVSLTPERRHEESDHTTVHVLLMDDVGRVLARRKIPMKTLLDVTNGWTVTLKLDDM